MIEVAGEDLKVGDVVIVNAVRPNAAPTQPIPSFAPVETIADIQRCYDFRLTLEPDHAYCAALRWNAAAPKAGTSKAAAPKNQSVAKKLQACLDIDDGTKGRLECDDAIFPPKPNPKAPAAKGVADCHFIKEEDDRLNCYNGFAEKIPKF